MCTLVGEASGRAAGGRQRERRMRRSLLTAKGSMMCGMRWRMVGRGREMMTMRCREVAAEDYSRVSLPLWPCQPQLTRGGRVASKS